MTTYPSGRPVPGMPDQDLRVEVARSGSALRLTVAGAVDFGTKDAFLDTVIGHLDRAVARAGDRVTEVRLDFSGLEHFDSSGLSALVLVHRRACAAGVRLRLVDEPLFLQRMLTITGLADHLATGPGACDASQDGGAAADGPFSAGDRLS